jgi:hypothetical protein
MGSSWLKLAQSSSSMSGATALYKDPLTERQKSQEKNSGLS